MERHIEREQYYLDTDYKTEVGKDWLQIRGVLYNHVHNDAMDMTQS